MSCFFLDWLVGVVKGFNFYDVLACLVHKGQGFWSGPWLLLLWSFALNFFWSAKALSMSSLFFSFLFSTILYIYCFFQNPKLNFVFTQNIYTYIGLLLPLVSTFYDKSNSYVGYKTKLHLRKWIMVLLFLKKKGLITMIWVTDWQF